MGSGTKLWLKDHSSRLRQCVGVLLIVVGLLLGYGWFYALAPIRHAWDHEWYFTHSQQEYWAEVQNSIHRAFWYHDGALTITEFGDKAWAEWIMTHLKRGETMDCGSRLSHSSNAMAGITNQDLGDKADAWFDWWEKNKSKSQEEWIADGFRQKGFAITLPPTPEQIPVLLSILGTPKSKLKYNAFRCLRDSGFEPVAYLIANRTPSPEIERGLLKYEKDLNRWPSASKLGILPFGQKSYSNIGLPVPNILTPRFQICAYALIFVPLLLGTALFRGSFWKKPCPFAGVHENTDLKAS